jgi:hypothetical protein
MYWGVPLGELARSGDASSGAHRKKIPAYTTRPRSSAGDAVAAGDLLARLEE